MSYPGLPLEKMLIEGCEMKIDGVVNSLKIKSQEITQQNTTQNEKFGNVLNSFIEQVKDSSEESANLTREFILGGNVEIHEVMIAAEKAKTDMMLLTEIRNKALETYNELSKMQI